ncbi:MAG TPA: hypothetical protein DD465_23100 [Thalassospira sp.]|nr:hypothetical protein [Thalassospira sp.]
MILDQPAQRLPEQGLAATLPAPQNNGHPGPFCRLLEHMRRPPHDETEMRLVPACDIGPHMIKKDRAFFFATLVIRRHAETTPKVIIPVRCGTTRHKADPRIFPTLRVLQPKP